MMTMIMAIIKMSFTRNMTRELSLEWAEAQEAGSQVKAGEFQAEASQVEDQVEAFQAGVSQVVSKEEELQHHRRHPSLLKKPRHLPLLLIQEASEGAFTDIRMFG